MFELPENPEEMLARMAELEGQLQEARDHLDQWFNECRQAQNELRNKSLDYELRLASMAKKHREEIDFFIDLLVRYREAAKEVSQPQSQAFSLPNEDVVLIVPNDSETEYLDSLNHGIFGGKNG